MSLKITTPLDIKVVIILLQQGINSIAFQQILIAPFAKNISVSFSTITVAISLPEKFPTRNTLLLYELQIGQEFIFLSYSI
jgi:hypothetical protein